MAEVLQALPEAQLDFSHTPLRRSSNSYTSFFLGSTSSLTSKRRNNCSYSDLRSDSIISSRSCSYPSTSTSSPPGSISMLHEDDDSGTKELALPSYSSAPYTAREVEPRPLSPAHGDHRPPPSPIDEAPSTTTTSPPEPLPLSEDDTAIKPEPSRQVDYLSHQWREEDIWSSWRHIVSRRSVYGERSRLENASWRAWAKSQFDLNTVSPETLNWWKDGDVTWLYGPLQSTSNAYSEQTSEPASHLSKNGSFINKRPILKKRSVSEVMLQKSISASSLVKQAAAAVQAQQARGTAFDRRRRPTAVGRTVSDIGSFSIPTQTVSRDATDYFSSRSTSGLQSPDHERKHIRFDDKVEQCIAVDIKEGDYDDDDGDMNDWQRNDDSDSSDEGLVMMKESQRKKKPLSRIDSRSSFTGESKTIAKLPSTTLKYRTDSPDIADQQTSHSLGFWRSGRLSPSPSQETLRPSHPSTNFLLSEEEEDGEDKAGIVWDPSGAYNRSEPGVPCLENASSIDEGGGSNRSSGLRRTASGMFMPLPEDEEDDPVPPGILGKVYDTVNTARDIAHVIWNVGWRN